MVEVSSLHIYPIKSCAPVALTAVRFDARGPLLDRRWMLIDGDGNFVTQRQQPRLSQIRPSITPLALEVQAPGMPTLKVPLSGGRGPRVRAQIWGHETEAEFVGDAIADWFSDAMQQNLRLVRWAEEAVRPVSKRHTQLDSQTAFSDGYPLLLTSEASLADLNRHMEQNVTMERFRPNIVVRGCDAFAEDTWRRFTIGDLTLHGVKPCDRCSVVDVDPRSGDVGKLLLATLSSYRKVGNRVLFGMNCVHEGFGIIREGDELRVLETGEPPIASG